MKKNIVISFSLLIIPLPAAACGPSPAVLFYGLLIVGAALIATLMIQSNAFSAAQDFMRGVTPDRGGPYWLLLGFAVDAGIFGLWIATGLAGVFGGYLLIAGAPKLVMALAGLARELAAMRSAKAVY